MKKILNIVSSINGDSSYSIKLSNAIIEQLSAQYPHSKVHTRNLTREPYPHLEEIHFRSFGTPENQLTPELQEAIKHSNQAIKEIKDADIIVIGVPIYNFTIPSTLKAWLDHIIRAGVTFSYANGRPEGLLQNKKVYLAIASGAVLSEGPMMAYDFAEPFLRAILGFIGLKDVTTFRVEGLAIPDFKDGAMPKAVGMVRAYAF